MNYLSELQLPYTRRNNANLDSGCSTEWQAGWSILTYGVRIGVRTNRPELLDRLAKHFPPLWKLTSVPIVERLFSLRIGSVHRLYDNSDEALTSRSLKTILEIFERRLKMYVAEMAPHRIFIHAGAVGWQGKAIIIPGRSMSGKTSLVAEMVRAGATYYSDEYAVLDSQGRLHPYPQPLAIRATSHGPVRQKKCFVEEFGGVAGSKPLPVGQVFVGRFAADARWRPIQLSTGQAVLELLDNTVAARRKPEIALPTLRRAVSEATLLKGVRGEARETAVLILKGRTS
jgi:hypothetical protein